jgi:exodeoxyribonuclease V beta subunit
MRGVSLIEASAGTGKTYTISHLYVRALLETDYGVEQILVVTFTNAATQELKGRIRKLIVQVRKYFQDASVDDEQINSLFGAYRFDKRSLFKLHKALVNFDEASIYSIHGFCQRVLTRFPIETGSLLQQQIITDEKDLLRAAMRDYWRQHMIDAELQKLEWIMQNWSDPDALLQDVMPLIKVTDDLQALTNDADIFSDQLEALWQSLRDEWDARSDEIRQVLLDNPALNKNRVQPKSVAHLFDELVTLFTRDLPYVLPAKWELLTHEKLTHCLKANCEDDRIHAPFFKRAGEFLESHVQWIRQQKTGLLLDVASTLKQRIDDVKKEALNISFDDLITRLSNALRVNNTFLTDSITSEYPFAMVDEFQDTDNRQYFIFQTLYQQRSDTTLILIGDPKQAIYGFRGADVFTYQRARADTSTQFTLDTNYRSSEHFIGALNHVFQYNEDAFVIDDLIEFKRAGFDPGKPKKLTHNGEVATPLVGWIYPFTKKPVSKSIAAEYFARVCAQEIAQLLQQGALQIENEPVQAQDLAVLVKTGRQASLIKQQLSERGIGSALVLRDSVFASEQAREITLLLEVLIEPGDIKALNGLLSSDLFGWNGAQIFNLQRDNERLVQMLEQMKAYQLHWQQKGILSMFFLLLKQQGTVLKNSPLMEGERRITNWLHILELLQQQAIEHASMVQALNWLRKQRQNAEEGIDNDEHQLRLESDSNLVRIVTIHKSKGLEYPIVFLPFMWDVKGARNQPKNYSVHDPSGHKKMYIHDEEQRERWHEENLAEEVRLFYVAMTRARYRCYLGWGNISGAGSSAIAQCLYQDHIGKGKHPRHLDISSEEDYLLPFNTINQAGELIQVIQQDTAYAPEVRSIQREIKLTRALPFHRRVERKWRISSYSQIASSGQDDHTDRPDYDALQTTPLSSGNDEQIAERSRFNFHKGARAGNFLHDLLEHQRFDEAVDKNIIQQACLDYGYETEWLPCLTHWLNDILTCDIRQNGLKLSNLKAHQKISEMEFYMNCNQLRPAELNDFLHRHHYSRPEQIFTFTEIRGFIKGFIDLVFEHEGQYFVADYKSNFLGAEKQHYTAEACNEAMFEHHYHLQYLVYTLALHRYLQHKVQDYDYEKHVGGVYYLFLRGLSQNDNAGHGIFFHKPAPEVMRELNDLFEGSCDG